VKNDLQRVSNLKNGSLPVAIIPARGGSKRIPKKNIKSFNGKPMISYAIKALIQSELFSDVIVSTDDPEIAKISESFGAFVPFFRSDELSGDSIGTVEVIADLIRSIELQESQIVCCAYATNPFLNCSNLAKGLNAILNNSRADFACAVCQYPYPIQRAMHLDTDGLMQMIRPENLLRHSQTFEDMWHDAGQFYFARVSTWLASKPMLMNTIGVEIDKWQCVDIDDEDDWQKAELLHKIIQ
jgi:pseudaminic acid cytidylyltransferase